MKTVRPRLVVVGIAPWDGAFFADRLPHAKVAESRYTPHQLGVEHLRFVPGQAVGDLPGLESGSLIRDSVALALCAGTASVDVLLARAEVGIHDFNHPRVRQLLETALGEVPGTVVVFPDATRIEHALAVTRTFGDALRTHFQTGVLDAPYEDKDVWLKALLGLRHHDIALAAWLGSEDQLARHGWRSAATYLGGRIAGAASPMHSILANKVPLPGGRDLPQSRAPWLGAPRAHRQIPEFAQRAVCELHLGDGSVSIASEPTLREPIGLWDLPLIRTSKVLHHRIVLTANLFVFREATPANALLLQSALQMALADFVKRDVLGGPEGTDQPQVHCRPDPNPGQPSLIASIQAYLKPWVREMRLELAVRPGHATLSEVA